ncbi:hypothetical protein [Lysinibacillus fusiformis]|uniref:hypothetical protein n=1 Tax=Lysinibacillus fusiformis TaxID=28031 RepID=UPI003CFF91D3
MTTPADPQQPTTPWQDRTCRTCNHLGADHQANECWAQVDGRQCPCHWTDLDDSCAHGPEYRCWSCAGDDELAPYPEPATVAQPAPTGEASL